MIKGVLQENRVQDNKYALVVQPGVGMCTLTAVSGLEQEIDKAELPDRTARSGGRTKAIEFDVTQPMHHTLEVLAWELWWTMCSNSVPGYLKLGLLTLFDDRNIPVKKFILPKLWITKRKHSDNELDSEGKMGTITWTLSADDIRAA